MESLKIASSVFIVVGFLLLLMVVSNSEDCHFDIERVNLICASTTNISEKALYVIISVFFFVLGFVLYKKSNEVSSF